jgi:hypothetical protein
MKILRYLFKLSYENGADSNLEAAPFQARFDYL